MPDQARHDDLSRQHGVLSRHPELDSCDRLPFGNSVPKWAAGRVVCAIAEA
jgi:hypothetical protein